MFSLLSSDLVAQKLGERVRLRRLSRNLSQQELSEMTGSSLSSIRRLEASGQGTVKALIRVAQALDAVDTLDGLFRTELRSIAQLDAGAQTRQRARKRLPQVTSGGSI